MPKLLNIEHLREVAAKTKNDGQLAYNKYPRGIRVEIILSAMSPELATAFDTAFADLDNWRVVRGPFESIQTFDCMVSAANSFGLMDGGVDAAITAFYGIQLQNRVQQHIIAEYLGEQPVGTAFVIGTNHEKHPWLVHAPTMRTPALISGTDAVYRATWAALVAIHNHNKEGDHITTVVFPAMGAGCGEVPAKNVAEQMALAWRNFHAVPTLINWPYAFQRARLVDQCIG